MEEKERGQLKLARTGAPQLVVAQSTVRSGFNIAPAGQQIHCRRIPPAKERLLSIAQKERVFSHFLILCVLCVSAVNLGKGRLKPGQIQLYTAERSTRLMMGQKHPINASPSTNPTKKGIPRRDPLIPPCLSSTHFAAIPINRGNQTRFIVPGATPTI